MGFFDNLKNIFGGKIEELSFKLDQLPTLKQGATSKSHVAFLQQRLIKSSELNKEKLKSDIEAGIFGPSTLSAVIYFQQTHLGPDNKPLSSDGIVGPATWWALINNIGEAQKQNLTKNVKSNSLIPSNLSDKRKKVLEVAIAEYNKNVKESPSGSNWGGEVSKYLKYIGIGANPWCCAFANWVVNTALGSLPWKKKLAHVATFYRLGKTLNMSHSVASGYKPKPGDMFIIVHENDTGHIGIILRVSSDYKTLTVVEGNTSDRVALRTRIVGQSQHVGYINYFGDENEPYNFEFGVLSTTDQSGIEKTR